MTLEIQLPDAAKPKLSGRFKFEAVKRDGTVRLLSDWFDNLILDQGLERLGNNATANAWQNCQVGTGSTPPAEANTGLASFLAGTSTRFSTASGRDDVNGYGWRRNVYAFAEGAVVGNISEVGTGWATTGAALFSRALIKDSFGNPTTISVLADETLRVTWELRLYWPTVDTSGTVVFTGNIGGTYNWTARAADIAGSNWIPSETGATFRVSTSAGTGYYGPSNLGAITASPTGTSFPISSYLTQVAYVAGSRQCLGKIDLPLAIGNNAGGIQSIKFISIGGPVYQMRFDTPIPKTATDVLSLTFGHSWSRRA